MSKDTLVLRAARWLRARVRWLAEHAAAQPVCARPFFAERRHRSAYPVLDEQGLLATKRSDTLFVFGSGASLNDVSEAEWRRIAEHDTIGFNYFLRQSFVRASYHLVGEIATGNDHEPSRWIPAIQEYARLIAENPRYRDCVLLVQAGWRAYQSNRLVASGCLPLATRLYRYRRIARGVYRPPTRSLREGLVHGAGTVVGCVSFGVAMGYRRIVIAGVDLYDSRYFWLPPDVGRPDALEHKGLTQEARHSTAATIVPYLGRWAEWLKADAVALEVYDARSLLAKVLPVHAG